MAPSDFALILTALIGGGALYKMLESVLVAFISRKKTVWEELREEITRLQEKIRDQDTRIEKLQTDIDRKNTVIDSYREKNLQLLAQVQRLEHQITVKDHAILALEDRVKRLKLAVRCSHSDECPALAGLTEQGEDDASSTE